MSILLSTIQTRLERRLGDIDDVDFLIEASNDLNRLIYDEVVTLDPSRYVTSTTYTVSASPSTQALPTDILKDLGFYVDDRKLALLNYGDSGPGYYLSGSNVVFEGLTDQTVTLRYVPELDALTSISDSFFVPDRFEEMILEGMVMMYYKYNEDEKLATQSQNFDLYLKRYLSKQNRTALLFGISSNNRSV